LFLPAKEDSEKLGSLLYPVHNSIKKNASTHSYPNRSRNGGIMSRSFRTKVVGVTHKNKDGSDRQKIISKCKVGDSLLLQRDYGNEYDEHAIAVLRTTTNEQLGFIARDVAFRHEGMNDLAPHLDRGGEVRAWIVDIIGGSSRFWERLFSSANKSLGCVIEIEYEDIPYQVKEKEARELRDIAKSLEKTEPVKAINLYKQCIIRLFEVDVLIRKTHAFKKQILELGIDQGTWRRTPFPIESLTALLEKHGQYSRCLSIIEKYERTKDKKGLSKSDLSRIAKRKSRMLHILASKKKSPT
jgi:hypothetical protein